MTKIISRAKLPQVKILSSILISAFILVIILLSRGNPDEIRKHEFINTQQARFIELKAAELILEKGAIPWDWDAGVFLSLDLLNRAFDEFEGVRATVSELNDVRLVVTEIDVEGGVGETRVRLSIDAFAEQFASAKLSLDAEAQLLYTHTEFIGSPPKPVARFRLSMLTVEPKVSLFSFRASSPELLSAIISEEAIKALGDELVLSIPVQHSLDMPIGLSDSKEIETNDGNGRVTIQYSMPESNIHVPINASIPLATEKGIWLLARADGDHFPLPDPMEAHNTPIVLASLLGEKADVVANRMKDVYTPNEDISVWVKGKFLSSIIGKFNTLDSDKRRISVSATNIEGKLSETSSEILGQHGGIYTELSSLSGNIDLSPISQEWREGTGLNTSIDLGASISAETRIHIDPYIGGGFSHTPAIKGDASHTVSLSLISSMIKIGGNSAFVFGPIFSCDNMQYELSTTGEIEFGVRMYTPVVANTSEPAFLLDTIPFYIALDEEGDGEREDVELSSLGYLEIAWRPIEANASNNGYMFTAAVEVQRVNQASSEDTLNQQRNALYEAVEAEWGKQTSPACPSLPPVKVLIAGQDFGPNNEFVKAAVFLTDKVSQLGHNVDVAINDIERVVKNPDQLDEVAKEIVDRTKAELKRAEDKVKSLGEKAGNAGQDVIDVLRFKKKLW